MRPATDLQRRVNPFRAVTDFEPAGDQPAAADRDQEHFEVGHRFEHFKRDGALARKLGRKQGGFGAYLDSTLDRLAEVILFGGFIYYYFTQDNPQMLAVAYVAVTGSLMVSYSRAKAESLGYENKVGVASRVERYILMIVMLILNLPQIALIILAVATYFTLGQRMYSVWKQEYGQDDS